MHVWQLGSLIFFGYVVAVADLFPGLTRERRRRAIAVAAVGGAVAIVSLRLSGDHPLNVWVVPPALLLIAYYASGCLFVAPMARIETLLAEIDASLGIDRISGCLPRALVECLELAYSGVYPAVALALFLALGQGVDAEHFWTVVLFTDYVCFGMMPWVQTRPPRTAGAPQPWRSSWRSINLRVLDAGSVHVNTFPSGHAAEALAAALLVSAGRWPIVACMFVAVAAISAGAVLGRYHYSADAITGWAVALTVWALV